jgi:hypothetical protein
LEKRPTTIEKTAARPNKRSQARKKSENPASPSTPSVHRKKRRKSKAKTPEATKNRDEALMIAALRVTNFEATAKSLAKN